MKLSLAVSRARLVVDESPPATLAIENDGVEPAVAPNPALSPTLPLLRVRGPEDAVREHAPGPTLASRGIRLLPEGDDDQPEVSLAPGARLQLEFELLERAAFPGPGEYEVEAVLRGRRDPKAAPPPEDVSPPVELVIEPLAPAWVAPCHGHGGFDDQAFVAWVQQGEPSTVHVRSLELRRGRPLPRLSFRVGEAGPDVRPVVSVTPAGAPAEQPRLVAWIEGDALRFVPFGERAPREPVASGRARIGIAPALLGPPVQDPRTGLARAIVRAGEGPISAVRLSPDVEDVGRDEVAVDAPIAAWSHVVAPARGGPRLLLLAQAEGAVELHQVAWDDAPRAVVRLGAWKGRLAAAAAVVTPDDVVEGTVLTWFTRRPGEEPRLIGARWRLDPGTGRFEAPTPRACAWGRHLGTPPITLRLDGRGTAHASFQDPEGRWHLAVDMSAPRPLFADDAPPIVGPVDLMFFGSGAAQPYLLTHRPEAGFHLEPLGGGGPPDPGSPEMAQPELGES